MSKSEVAQTFGVSLSSVKRYVAMARERRPLTPKKRTALRPKIDEQAKRLLQADLQKRPAATLPQRREFLQRVAGVRVSVIRQIAAKGAPRSYQNLKKRLENGD